MIVRWGDDGRGKTVRKAILVVVAGLAVVLAGCTGEPDGGATEVPPETAGPSPAEEIVETRTITVGGGEIEAAVHPLVRDGEHIVLTLDLTPTVIEGVEPREMDIAASAWFELETAPGARLAAGALRLVDPEALRIHLPAIDADGDPVASLGAQDPAFDEPVRIQQVYGAPEGDTASLGLLLPGWYVEDVPIIDAEVPAPALPDGGPEDPIALESVAEAPVVSLDSLTRQLDGAVQVIESTEEVRVDLSGDVLFEFGSAALTAGAEAALDASAAALEAREGGTIEIVGHTDDVGDDASNQVLSEQRAAAVEDALARRIDTSAFDLQASGRGESEPLVANDTDANRQLNRRVTLTLTTTSTTRSEIAVEGELPPFEDGSEVTGAEGYDDATRSAAGDFHVEATSAQRVGGMLVVTIEATRTDEGRLEPGWAFNLAAGPWSFRGDHARMPQYPFAPRLRIGATAVYPLDYRIDAGADGTEEWRLAGQNDAQNAADTGQTLRYVALYPDVADAETITLENAGPVWATRFRLTDIPIE